MIKQLDENSGEMKGSLKNKENVMNDSDVKETKISNLRIWVPLSFLLAHGLGHSVALALKTRSLLNTSEVTQWTKQTMDFTSHRNITIRPHSVLRLPEHNAWKLIVLLLHSNMGKFFVRMATKTALDAHIVASEAISWRTWVGRCGALALPTDVFGTSRLSSVISTSGTGPLKTGPDTGLSG